MSSSVGRITGRALGRTVQTAPRQRLLDAPPQAIQGVGDVRVGLAVNAALKDAALDSVSLAQVSDSVTGIEQPSTCGAIQEPHHGDYPQLPDRTLVSLPICNYLPVASPSLVLIT